MLEAQRYNEVLVRAVARPKEDYEGPGRSWTEEYPIDLEYAPQAGTTACGRDNRQRPGLNPWPVS